MSRLKRLLQEVHQRSLWQLLASYIVGAWLILQIAETLASLIGLPLWFGASVIALLAFGLVLVLTTGLVQVVVAVWSRPDKSYGGLRRVFSWKNALIAGVITVAMLVVGTTGYMGMRVMGIGPWGTLVAKGLLEERDRIVLADFENHSSDSLLSIAVTEAFRTDLSQSRLIWLVDPDYVSRVLARMEREPTEVLDYDLAREVAIREGLKALIAGEVNSAGAGYILSARLVSAGSGETISAHRETAHDPTAVIPAIERLSKHMRERIGESFTSIRGNEPLARVTTASLEALKKLSLASQARRLGNFERAIALYEEAIALDTAFAAAYAGLGATQFNNGELAQAAESLTRAFELRDRGTERERYGTIGLYHLVVSGDLGEATDAYRVLVEISDSTAGLNQLAILYSYVGDFALAERLYRRAIEADSFIFVPYHNLYRAQIQQGRLEEAEVTVRRWAERFPENDVPRVAFAELPAVRGDYLTAEARFRDYSAYVDTVGGRSERERIEARWRVAWTSANIATARGKLAEAAAYLRGAMAASRDLGDDSRYFWNAMQLALLDVWFRGATERGTQFVESELDRYPLNRLRPMERPFLALALFYALTEQPERAKEFVAQYDSTWGPSAGGFEQRPIRRRIGGVVALADGQTEEAIQQFGQDESRRTCRLEGCPLLAWAYERAGEADSAVASYERYLETRSGIPSRTLLHPRLVQLADPFWLAFTYERLGALYEQRGDTAKAIYYYGKLVDLWKDADPELQPRVEAARRAIEALSPDT